VSGNNSGSRIIPLFYFNKKRDRVKE
jgi:hypothetical protein